MRKAFGIGVVDVGYPVKPKIELPRLNGRRQQKNLPVCRYYTMWYEMLRRCYSERYKQLNPSYRNVSCIQEWHYLSNFKNWVTSNYESLYDCHGKLLELDKDLRHNPEKVYSPDTCLLLPKTINVFIADTTSLINTSLPVGVSLSSNKSKVNPYACRWRCPLEGKEFSKSFSDSMEAHEYWKSQKLLVMDKLLHYYKVDSNIRKLVETKIRKTFIDE